MSNTFGLDLPWLKERIVVISIHGPISSSSRVSEQVRLLRTVARDKRVRSVIIDIDSPGGSAALSDNLQRAVIKLANRKPVIAYVRNLGLSGGYLVACGATKLIALPTAMVGSIGVIIARPVVRELLERMGVQMFVTKAGKYKDMMQPWREPTKEEGERLDDLRDEIYDWFIEQVAETRNLEPNIVREYATGEMFTARKAKKIGLIDELGDFDTALDIASEMGKVSREVSYLRPRRTFLEQLLSPVSATVTRQVMAELETKLSTRIEISNRSLQREDTLTSYNTTLPKPKNNARRHHRQKTSNLGSADDTNKSA